MFFLKSFAMEFTDEEKIWLQTVSSEIPEGDELTPKEKQLQEKAKPETEFHAQLFQTMAFKRFGLNGLITSTIEVKNCEKLQQRCSVSSQCG
ncbi:hypothetical protein QQF64_027624 [Cirrhinus molitorella]|uniref:Uncharacterized protein n=2 Tax=Cirrhinus molitorella TaxID=172907 RepID=A0ABR3NDP4_9TELE|nr:hypothetical protein Q8A67_003913 [Cirrhinus molitorella]